MDQAPLNPRMPAGWVDLTEPVVKADPITGWYPSDAMLRHINLKEAEALLHAIRVYDLTNLQLNFSRTTRRCGGTFTNGGSQLGAQRHSKTNLGGSRSASLSNPSALRAVRIEPGRPSEPTGSARAASRLSLTRNHERNKTLVHQRLPRIRPHSLSAAGRLDGVKRKYAMRPIYHRDSGPVCSGPSTDIPGMAKPPWFLIPKILGYWAKFPSQATALTVLPYKPHASWWPLRSQMLVGKPLYVSNLRDAYLLPNDELCRGPGIPLCVCILRGLDNPPLKKRKLTTFP